MGVNPDKRLKSLVVDPKLAEIQLFFIPFIRLLNENEASSFSRANEYEKLGSSRSKRPVLSAL